MKKITAIIIAIVLVSFTGCGKEKVSDKNLKKEIQKTEPEVVLEKKPSESALKKEPADEDIVAVSDYIPDIVIDLRYATEENFTGVVIYEDNVAYLRYGTVKKLSKVQEKLREKGMGLLIWDAYRPSEAQFKLWEICPDSTYVANPNTGFSSHSRGNTVDITVVTQDGKEIEMPSEFDEFTAKANREYSDVTKEAATNSAMLEKIMTECGFEGYSGEWWHYADTTVYPVAQ